MPEPEARPFYLDCDTGVDDALALTYLVATPSVDLRGVGTVSGNTDAVTAARNTVDLLALLDRPDIPVAVGAQHPLSGRFGGGSPDVHGANGIGVGSHDVFPTAIIIWHRNEHFLGWQNLEIRALEGLTQTRVAILEDLRRGRADTDRDLAL